MEKRTYMMRIGGVERRGDGMRMAVVVVVVMVAGTVVMVAGTVVTARTTVVVMVAVVVAAETKKVRTSKKRGLLDAQRRDTKRVE